MNYRAHTGLSIGAISFIAAYFFQLNNYLPQEIILFWLMGVFHTIFASPDIDHPTSRPTKNIWIIGKITSKIFRHRGILHNPLAWTIGYFILGCYIKVKYNYEAWWFTGGLIAIYIHIFLDKMSTGIKRMIHF